MSYGVKRVEYVPFVSVGNIRSGSALKDAHQGVQAFGARIRDLRKARGLTQEDLARALSYSRSYHQVTIAKIEGSLRPTSVEELYLLAAVLDVQVIDFFTTYDAKTRLRLDHLLAEVERTGDELAKAREREAKLEADHRQAQARYEEARARSGGKG